MKQVCVAALLAAVLAVGSIATSNVWASAGAERAGSEVATLEDPLNPVADWLMERDNLRQRAAGIEYRLSMNGMHWSPTFDSASLMEELEGAIADTDDAPSLSWLAGACLAAGVQELCIDAGLDEAIVQYDGGNFFSRMALREQPDVNEARRLLLESSVQRAYYPERVAVWHDALQHHDLQHPDGVNDLGFALFAGASSLTLPSGLHEACTTETDSSSNWNHACGRLAADMAENGRTAMERMLGWSLLEERADALGDSIRAAEYADQRNAFTNHFHCVGGVISSVADQLDAPGQREYVGWLIEHGELGAMERLAERNGLDCSDPPDARAEAMRRLLELEPEPGAQP